MKLAVPRFSHFPNVDIPRKLIRALCRLSVQSRPGSLRPHDAALSPAALTQAALSETTISLHRRYNVPRIAFVNKLDREGANPEAVTEQLRSKLKLNAAMIQVPIGLSAEHVGVCDLVELRATTFEGPNGDPPTLGPIPAELEAQVQAKRAEMLERLAPRRTAWISASFSCSFAFSAASSSRSFSSARSSASSSTTASSSCCSWEPKLSGCELAAAPTAGVSAPWLLSCEF